MVNIIYTKAENSLSKNTLRDAGLTSLLQWQLMLLLCAIPFHSVIIFPNISVIKAVGFIILPIWIIWAMVKLFAARGVLKICYMNGRILLVIGFLICLILISAFYEPISPTYFLGLLTVISGVMMAIIIYTLVLSEAAMQRMFTILSIGGMVFGFLIILQFLFPQEFGAIWGQRVLYESFGGVKIVRATGPFRNPNYAAFTLIVMIIISLYSALARHKEWQRFLMFTSIPIQAVALLLTFSRGGYITLALVGSIILWRERHELHLWKAAIPLAFMSFVLLASIGSGITELVASRTSTLATFYQSVVEDPASANQVDLSLWYRVQLILAGIRMTILRFPLGVGWENFPYYVRMYSDEVLPQVAHNTFVSASSELGLFGLIAIGWLMLCLWKSVNRLGNITKGKLYLFVKGTKYALLAIMIEGMFLIIFHEAIVWAIVGLIMSQNQIVLGRNKV